MLSSTNAHCTVAYDAADEVLTLDRSGAQLGTLPAAFAAVHRARVPPIDGHIDLDMLVDWGSVEVFVNDGRVVLTDLIPGLDAPVRIELPAGPAIQGDVRPLEASMP